LLALLVVLVWGLNFIAIKWGVEEIPPLLLTALRYLCAALPAVFFIRPPKIAARVVIAYGVMVGVCQFGLLFVAIHMGMPAGLASLVIQMQAFFTFGLAIVFLGERPGLLQVGGALVALGGIAVIGVERADGTALWPLLMTLLGAVFWGGANVITKKAGRIDMLAFVVWASLVPPLPLLGLSFLLEGPDAIGFALMHLSARSLGVIAFNGYASTLVGFGLWSILLARYPASVVAPFSLLVPVVGIASAVLVLGEPLSGLEVAGSVLVFAGLLLNVFGPRRRAVAAAS
jgi:O-acetylserine/cysteine efflux transporter